MEAKLLTPEQFADIANLRSVPDIADYLRKNTAYAEVLDTYIILYQSICKNELIQADKSLTVL